LLRRLTTLAMMGAFALTGCSTPRGLQVAAADSEAGMGRPVVIYVVRRHWHTDLGFSAGDLPLPLAALRAQFPAARYLLFGFGDRHYLVNHDRGMGGLVGALWPGQGVVLVSGLAGTPEQAFGADSVIRLTLSAAQARRLEHFVWNTLGRSGGVAEVLAVGPYDASFYYAATPRYSAVNTCNTWTAAALKAAGLPLHSVGVEFSSQVWRQVRRIEQEQKNCPAQRCAALPAQR
jgi:uncharacterized protein (TIGR02117 family)